MVSRRIRLAVVGVLVAGAAVATALAFNSGSSEASAVAGTCTLTVPAKLSINAPYMKFAASRSCVGVTVNELSWTGQIGTGPIQRELWFLFENQIVGDYHDSQSLGQLKWTGSLPPDAAAAKAAADVAFNSPVTDVRVESFSSMSVDGANTAGKTTLDVLAQRYATSLDKFVSYAGATGIIRYKESASDTTWKSLKNVGPTDAYGKYRYTYTHPVGSHRIYQVQIYDATNIWGTYGIVDQ